MVDCEKPFIQWDMGASEDSINSYRVGLFTTKTEEISFFSVPLLLGLDFIITAMGTLGFTVPTLPFEVKPCTFLIGESFHQLVSRYCKLAHVFFSRFVAYKVLKMLLQVKYIIPFIFEFYFNKIT